MAERIIIDCDPGIDDAVAVLMALASPEVDVRGLSTVFGNADIAATTRNARTLLRVAGRTDLPVGRGADGPLIGRYGGPVPHIHGHDGLGDGGIAREASDDTPADTLAVELLRREAMSAPGRLTILAIGPLTNLALFARLYPEAARAVGRVVVMGGAAFSPGNVTPAAEANVRNDPEAAAIVFGFDWPVTMIGLDVTDRTVLEPRHLDGIVRRHDLLGRALPLYRSFYAKADEIDGIVAHDAAALAYVIRPDHFVTSDLPLRVELAGIGRGKIWVLSRRRATPPEGWEGSRSVGVAISADHAAVADLIAARLS